MRGKLLGRVLDDPADRIIPAHAGQTGRVSPCRNPCSDHPRACGANPIPPEKWKGGRGSSPRMRGKQREQLDFERVFRIIPAHAGQTTFLNKTLANPADHPRACGANLIVFGVVHTHLGSSPRMRGKLEVKEFKSTATRIIPAHAGQTSTLGMTVVRPSDHPRACGANFATLVGSQLQNGSSPRMRGKRRFSRSTRRDGRIIPAHAGQTVCGACSTSVATDHPRACGANGKISSKTMVRTGSSPRMRGKLTADAGDTHSRRIIPAHAGQTYATKTS